MTTGSVLIGNTQTNLYYNKSWNGTDGAIDTKTIRLIRPSYTKIHVEKVKVKIGKRTYIHHVVTKREVIPAKYSRGRRIKSGEHSYTMDEVRINRSQGVGPIGWLSDWTGATFPVPISNNGMVTLGSRMSKLAKGHSFNSSVAFAEIDKTLAMATSTVQRFSRSIAALRKGNIADAARHLGTSHRGAGRVKPLGTKEVADAWLELQFGWKPLLSDVHDAGQAMAYHCNEPRYTKGREAVTEKRSYSYHGPTQNNYYESRSTLGYNVIYMEKLSVPRSLGLLDPVSTVWERLPFSFVVDWFIPIGTYLENYNILPHVNGQYTKTEKYVIDEVAFGYAGSNLGGSNIGKRVLFIRTPNVTLYPVKPEFHLPHSQANTVRLGDSLAILRQSVEGFTHSGNFTRW